MINNLGLLDDGFAKQLCVKITPELQDSPQSYKIIWIKGICNQFEFIDPASTKALICVSKPLKTRASSIYTFPTLSSTTDGYKTLSLPYVDTVQHKISHPLRLMCYCCSIPNNFNVKFLKLVMVITKILHSLLQKCM